MGRRLLQEASFGLARRCSWEQLHGSAVRLITTTQADALREALAGFPTSVLKIVERPQDFYGVHVEAHPGRQLRR